MVLEWQFRFPPRWPAVIRLLLSGGPSTVSGFIVAVMIRVSVYCHSIWSFPHVTKEFPKTLAPVFANCNASSAVVAVLIVIFVGASLDHISPTDVRPFVAIASRCLTITQSSLRVIGEAAAQYATRQANGFPGLWVFHSPPYAHPAPNLHLDASGQFRHRLATGTSTTRRVSSAKICSLDRHLLKTFASTKKVGFPVPSLDEPQDG
jgi:hypothetical protein